MNCKNKIFSIGGLALLLIGANSCKPKFTDPSVPNPTGASARIGNYDYMCQSSNSPVSHVLNGLGSIVVLVTGEAVPQFYQRVAYRPNNFSYPLVTLENGTGKTAYHSLSYPDKASFDVPFSGNYKIRSYYIEYGIGAPSNSSTGNSSNCSNPAAGKCYRWTKQVLLNSGTIPQYTAGFAFIIDSEDPDGFKGSCE